MRVMESKLKIILAILFCIFVLPKSAHAGLITSVPSSLGLTSGLVGWWTMDDPDISGANLTDKSGNNNTGTISGAVPIIGKLGQALSSGGGYDAPTLAVNVGNSSSLNFTDAKLTIAAWVKTSHIGSNGAAIFTRYDSNDKRSYFFGINNNLVLRWSTYSDGTTGGNTVHYAGSQITGGEWNFVAITVNGSEAKFYINGNYVNTVTTESSTIYASDVNNYIGAAQRVSANPDLYFEGSMDEVRAYSRTLSASEVKRLYNMGGGLKVGVLKNNFAKDPHTKAYFRFEPGHLTRDEISGNENFLTNNNVIQDTSHQFEGTGSANFDYYANEETSKWFETSDANLPSGFPLKNGESNFDLSVAFFYQPGPAWQKNDYATFFTKVVSWDTPGGGIILRSYGSKLQFLVQKETGDASESLSFPTAFVDGNRYFVAATYRNSDRLTRLHVYDLTNNRLLASDVVDNISNNGGDYDVLANTAPFVVSGSGFYRLDGYMDSYVVANDVWTPEEIDQIMKQAYGRTTTVGKAPAGGSLSSGLVGYWTFDDPDISGASVTDKSPVGTNTGTIVGATKTIGKLGQALKFNGTSNYVNSGNIQLTNSLTITGWVKLNTLSAGNGGSQTLASQNQAYGLEVVHSTGKLVCVFTTQGKAWNYCDTNSTGSLTPNTWYYISLTKDNNGYTYYINGVASGGGTDYNGNLVTGSDPTVIGSRMPTVGSSLLNGSIDDVRIYNRALSASEVKRLYQMGK
jgi:hypothetical protein